MEGNDREPTARTSDAKSRVEFDTITVSFHDIALGDNPATKSGPPIHCSWKPATSTVYDLNEYEPQRDLDRVGKALRIPGFQRKGLLREAGYLTADIQRSTAIKDANLIRKSRKATIKSNPVVMERREELSRQLRCRMEVEPLPYIRSAASDIATKSILKRPHNERKEIENSHIVSPTEVPFGKGLQPCRRCTYCHMDDEKAAAFLFHGDEVCVLLQRIKEATVTKTNIEVIIPSVMQWLNIEFLVIP